MNKKIMILFLISLLCISGCKKNDNETTNNVIENTVNNTIEEVEDPTNGLGYQVIEPQEEYTVEDETVLEQKCNDDVCVRIDSFGYRGDFGSISMIITKANANTTSGSFKIKFDTTCTPNEYKIVYDFTEKEENEYELQYKCKDLLKTTGYTITTVK